MRWNMLQIEALECYTLFPQHRCILQSSSVSTINLKAKILYFLPSHQTKQINLQFTKLWNNIRDSEVFLTAQVNSHLFTKLPIPCILRLNLHILKSYIPGGGIQFYVAVCVRVWISDGHISRSTMSRSRKNDKSTLLWFGQTWPGIPCQVLCNTI